MRLGGLEKVTGRQNIIYRPARNNSNYLLISNCPSEDNKNTLASCESFDSGVAVGGLLLIGMTFAGRNRPGMKTFRMLLNQNLLQPFL